MAEHKKQHYLAKSYLKKFSPYYYVKECDSIKKKLVWYYNRQNGILRIKSVNNIAFKPYYYSFYNDDGKIDHSLEKLFSKIENKIIILINKIEDTIDRIKRKAPIPIFTTEERVTLCEFVYLNMTRIPEIFDNIISETEKHEKNISLKYKTAYSQNKVKNLAIHVLLKMGKRKEANILQLLLRKNSQIIYIPKTKASFITTDNPVIRINHNGPNGLFYKETDIYLPLCQSAILKLYGIGDYIDFINFRDLSDVFKYNYQFAELAYSEIFGNKKEYLKEVIEKAGLTINEIRVPSFDKKR